MKTVYLTNKQTMETFLIDPDNVAAVVVDLCGGGYTTKQTAEAMQVRHKLEIGGIAFENVYYKLFTKG